MNTSWWQVVLILLSISVQQSTFASESNAIETRHKCGLQGKSRHYKAAICASEPNSCFEHLGIKIRLPEGVVFSVTKMDSEQSENQPAYKMESFSSIEPVSEGKLMGFYFAEFSKLSDLESWKEAGKKTIGNDYESGTGEFECSQPFRKNSPSSSISCSALFPEKLFELHFSFKGGKGLRSLSAFKSEANGYIKTATCLHDVMIGEFPQDSIPGMRK